MQRFQPPSAVAPTLALVVFDSDQTIWPFTLENHTPPFAKKDGEVVDANGEVVKLYPDTAAIFEEIKKRGIRIAVASQEPSTTVTDRLFTLFGVRKYVNYTRINPGAKILQFMLLAFQSRTQYTDMIYFDNNAANIKEIEVLGIFCVHVPENGITMELYNESVEKFKQLRGIKE